MSYQDESDLKYIDETSDIPITGDPDPWSPDEKLSAAEKAESKLESDVNEGSEIGNPEGIHGDAANAWATYLLALGMKTPDSGTRGDSLDEGTERMDFAMEVKSMYNDLVSSITTAEDDASEGGASTVDFEVIDVS